MRNIPPKILIGSALTVFAILMSIAFIDAPILRTAPNLPPELIKFFRIVTEFGLSQWYLVPAAFIASLSFFLWRRKNSAQAKLLFMRFSYLFLVIATSGIVVNILKPIFARARPKEWYQQQIEGFFHWSKIAHGELSHYNSFPSGHSSTAIALTLGIAFLLPERFRQFGWLALALGFLISISRIIVGSHHVSDVIAGGFISVLCCIYWQRYYLKKFPEFPKPHRLF